VITSSNPDACIKAPVNAAAKLCRGEAESIRAVHQAVQWTRVQHILHLSQQLDSQFAVLEPGCFVLSGRSWGTRARKADATGSSSGDATRTTCLPLQPAARILERNSESPVPVAAWAFVPR
jgi:hypothetical protein